MKTVQEVLDFLDSEIVRLTELGTYDEDVSYIQSLIEQIKG
jgi:hypothetical protein